MIQIENTPNPNALKFLSENTISEIGTIEFQKDKISEIKNNFVKNLFNCILFIITRYYNR